MAWQHGMPIMSHFLQLHFFSSKSTMKLSSPLFNSNLVWLAQHASHLLHANFSLYSLFLILGHNSDSTFIIISLFAWNLVIRYSLIHSSYKHIKRKGELIKYTYTSLWIIMHMKRRSMHAMVIIGLFINLTITLLKLSHMLFRTVSLWPSLLNMCLAQIVVEWDCSHLNASSSTSFSSFIALSYAC